MQFPSTEQIVTDVVETLGLKATDAEIEARILDLGRLTDDELAEVGAIPLDPAMDAPEARREPTVVIAEPLEFAPVALKRRDGGWTAERQRAFIAALAETGSVSQACAEVGITPRSAYKLREHPKARSFCEAWSHALSLASARLASIAFERAIHGGVERIYRKGELVEERRKPSDKLLMWLLGHIDPAGFGWLSRSSDAVPHFSFYRLEYARKHMPKELKKLSDIDPADCPAEPALPADFDPYDVPSPA